MDIGGEIWSWVPVGFDSDEVPDDVDGDGDSDKAHPDSEDESTKVAWDHVEDY